MRRLIAGAINAAAPEDDWEQTVIDIQDRPIWDRELGPVEPDLVMDVADMSHFADETFDEVRLWHVLEHLTPVRGRHAVEECQRVLVRGGVLDIEVPDLDRIARAWLERELEWREAQQWLYGEWLDHYALPDVHRCCYSEDELIEVLATAGFQVPLREDTGYALRFRAVRL